MLRHRLHHRIGVLGLSALAMGIGIAAGAAGCGDSEGSKAAAPGADAAQAGQDGAGGDGSSVSPAPVTIDIVVSSATVYAGQRAQLLASQSKASNGDTLNFGWSFAKVPPGSAIVNSSIEGINELVSFVPDIAGDYVITVTATTGNVTAKKDITVVAHNAPVFYVRTTTGATVDDLGYEMRTVQMDGTGEKAVACRQSTFRNLPADFTGDAGIFEDAGDGGGESMQMLGMMNYMMVGLFADQALDWWEAPAGEPSKAAFQNTLMMGDAGPDAPSSQVSLVVATQDNSCQNPPFAARTFAGKGGDGVFQPKFSPDGRRIAFVERKDEKAVLITTAIDGSDARVIGNVCEDGTDQCFSKKYIFPRRPQWLDETHVGWMRIADTSESATAWEIVVAPDLESAPISRYLTCSSGAAPLLFNFLRDGNIIVNASATKKGAENLYVMRRNAGGACQVVRNLTNLTIDGSYARDFAVSPDGTQVAYVQKIGDPSKDAGALDIRQGGELWIVPIDGSGPATPVGPIPRGANYGPRWIAAGTKLAWNGMAPPPAGYDAGIPTDAEVDAAVQAAFFEAGLPAITVIQPDGGGYTTVAVGDPLNGSYVLGGGNGGSCTMECNSLGCAPQCGNGESVCGVAPDKQRVARPEGPTFWASMFGLALLLRRARRRRSGGARPGV